MSKHKNTAVNGFAPQINHYRVALGDCRQHTVAATTHASQMFGRQSLLFQRVTFKLQPRFATLAVKKTASAGTYVDVV